MSQTTWLESRKKRASLNAIVIILVLAVGVAFLYNNREVLFSFLEKKNTMVAKAGKAHDALGANRHAENDIHALKNEPVGRVAEKEPAGRQRSATPENHIPPQTISLPDIRCTVRGREDVVVVVSLELMVGRDQLKKEALLKREDLKTMVRKVVAGKTLEELIIDSLRPQTKTSMDRILENGALTDVVFRTFRIEKVK